VHGFRVYPHDFLINLADTVETTFITSDKESESNMAQMRRPDTPAYYVYILLCENNSFYTGYTKSVKSRFRLHINGKGARYTKMHNPQSLVYVEKFGSRSEAMKREKRIKKLNHSQKLKLADSYKKSQKPARKKRRRQDSEQM
jgi:putative endonuclease